MENFDMDHLLRRDSTRWVPSSTDVDGGNT